MVINISKNRWKRVWMFLSIGIAVLTATGVLTFSKDRIIFLFSSKGMEHFPESHLQIILMFATLFLIYQWIRIHIGEIQMLEDNLEEFLPPLPRPSFALIITLAILLGILGFFSYNIVIYSSIFVFFSIFDIWSIYYRNKTIKEALKKALNETTNKISAEKRKNLREIEIYFIERPHMQRSTTVIFFSFISLIFGIIAQLYPEPNYVKLFLSLAYGIMSLNIIISEIIINRWRKNRDNAIGEYYT